jgi:hypothetical protein
VTHATYYGESVDPDEEYMLRSWRRFEPTLADGGWLDSERRLNAVIRQEAQERHLPLVETADVLSGPGNFVDSVHFTDQGSRKMVHLIADKVIGNSLLVDSLSCGIAR